MVIVWIFAVLLILYLVLLLLLRIIAIRIQLDLVAVVDLRDILVASAILFAALRQAEDLKIRVGFGLGLDILAVPIAELVVLRQRVDRLHRDLADLIKSGIAIVGLAVRRVVDELRRDLHIAERGVRRAVIRLSGKTVIGRRHGRERIVLRRLAGIRLDGQRSLVDDKRRGHLMRGVVLRLVHVQRDDIVARVDRGLLGHVAVLLDVEADGHVARVGQVIIGNCRCCTGVRHGVVGCRRCTARPR